jgi:hypothetical protein
MESAAPIEDEIIESIRNLTVSEQREVLDFARFLASRGPARGEAPEPLKGIWADQPKITDEDIAEVRREMARDFGRESLLEGRTR